MKIVVGGQICVRNCSKDFHENPTNCLLVSLVVGQRRTD